MPLTNADSKGLKARQMIAQGNALGSSSKTFQALQGRQGFSRGNGNPEQTDCGLLDELVFGEGVRHDIHGGPTARFIPAWGNALGTVTIKAFPSANGAADNNLGQRPMSR